MDSKEQAQAAEEHHPGSPGAIRPLPETTETEAEEQTIAHTRQIEHPLGHYKSHVEEQIAGGQKWQYQEGNAHQGSRPRGAFRGGGAGWCGTIAGGG